MTLTSYLSHFIIDRQRPPDGEDEKEKSTCKESTIVADSSSDIMYGGEAEHDGCVRASTTTSVAYSCTTVAFRAKEESLESVEPGFIGDKKEVSCLFNHQLCTRPVQDLFSVGLLPPKDRQG